mmetsp:Transcript_3223/g.9682  ORF Transcript_3223/g.9682 Transcript_3223/m.9682 type:complete len:139 (-) Transcript_3223:512-928(-)
MNQLAAAALPPLIAAAHAAALTAAALRPDTFALPAHPLRRHPLIFLQSSPHRRLSTEMPPLSPSHASPPSHRRRYRCCPDPGAGTRLPYLTTTTTVAARSRAPPPPSRRPVPTLPEGEALCIDREAEPSGVIAAVSTY